MQPELKGLVERLFAPDQHERALAATRLGQQGSAAADALPFLLDALGDPFWLARSTAAEALGKVGDKRAVDPLMELVRRDPAPSVRGRAAVALGRLQDRRACKALIEAMSDMDTHVRYLAAGALGELGDPLAEPALAKAVRYDSHPRVREAAAESLKLLPPKAADEASSPRSPEAKELSAPQ